MELENKTVLSAVVGSHAYGLNHSGSDVDKMSIFVAPTVEVAGMFWNAQRESSSTAGPVGDDDSSHEIGKFLRLVLKSNPTLIELLFMDDYEILDEVGQGMVDLRDKMLYTEGIRNAYLGYAFAQHARVRNEFPDHKPKMARHCLRISRQATELLTTGAMDVKVPNRQEYFDLTEMSFTDMDEVMVQAIEEIRHAESVLPDKPDKDAVNEFLKEVRRNYVG